jgi:hypothetical protein
MGTSAVNSALSGIAAAQTMFDASAQAASRIGDPAPDAGDSAAAVVGATAASEAFGVNVAVLAKALQAERYLVDVFA